jgi:peroxiredoxin Q/BCP
MRILLASVLLAMGCNNAPAADPTAAASSNATATPSATASANPADYAGSTTDPLVGKPAPDFTKVTFDNKEVHVAAMKGKPVVIYFYPKDETPGCTKEACSFRDAWKDLAATGVNLVGVSMDDAESHRKFAEHHKLPFLLVTDDGSIAKAYGVPTDDGYTARQTFVVGADGNVKKVYRKVKVAEHTAQVIADLK